MQLVAILLALLLTTQVCSAATSCTAGQACQALVTTCDTLQAQESLECTPTTHCAPGATQQQPACNTGCAIYLGYQCQTRANSTSGQCCPAQRCGKCPNGYEVDRNGCRTCKCIPATTPTPAPSSNGCICPALFKPVCGADGQTYSNACSAACASVPVEYEGECKGSCGCSLEYDPVCASNGFSYANRCLMECDGLKFGQAGHCKDRCFCSLEYKPVCGGGRTFTNACEARCGGQKTYTSGKCQSDCICTAEFAPVCGMNNVTYSNSCQAKCDGISVFVSGDCATINAAPAPSAAAITTTESVFGTSTEPCGSGVVSLACCWWTTWAQALAF